MQFTPKKLAELKKAYNNCTEKTFVFDGQEILKAYAKYMIEFLERQFGMRK